MMKMIFKVLVILFILNEIAFAGFGRGGSSGSRSYSSGSSRSYSSYRAPRQTYYSQPKRVVREYHYTNTVHSPSSSGGGIHPLTAGMAGYLIGDAMNRNHGVAQQQPPQVVYVNGQPQQVASSSNNAAPVTPEALPPAYQPPMPYVEPQKAKEEGGSSLILILFGVLSLLFVGSVFYQLGKKRAQ